MEIFLQGIKRTAQNRLDRRPKFGEIVHNTHTTGRIFKDERCTVPITDRHAFRSEPAVERLDSAPPAVAMPLNLDR